MITQLKRKWQELLRPFSIPDVQVEEAFGDLVRRYGEDGRFYHNLSHIHYTLQTATQLKFITQDWTAVQLAIWFHDVIYNPRDHDNEEQSALYAAQVLGQLGIPAETVLVVQRLILLTKRHETAETDVDGQVLLDADLAILAAEWEAYGRYAQAIRQEYAFVPEADYRQGRREVLNRFLQRSHLFFTRQMIEFGETRARQNLSREITDLTEGES